MVVVLWVLLGILLVFLLLLLLLCFPIHLSFSYDVRRTRGKPKPAPEPPEQESEPVLQDFPDETTETILARLLLDAEKKNQPQPKPEKEFVFIIRYLFFRFQLLPKKEKTKKRKPKREKPIKEPKKKKTEEKNETEGLATLLDLVKLALTKAKKPLGMIGRDILFHKLRLNIVVATEDAGSTAIWYGRLNALLYGVLAMAQSLLRVQDTKIAIRPDFRGEPDRADVTGSFQVRFHPIVFMIAAPRFAIPFFRELSKQKKESAQNGQPMAEQSENSQPS